MANTEVIEKWVTALESGEYKQTKGYLSVIGSDDIVRHCCLGVLCDLAVNEGVITPGRVISDTLEYGVEDQRFVLPAAVKEWAGFEHESPEVGVAHLDFHEKEWDDDLDEYFDLPETVERLQLANLNDDKDKNFVEIADLVRREFLA